MPEYQKTNIMKLLRFLPILIMLLLAGNTLAQSKGKVTLSKLRSVDTVTVGTTLKYTGNVHHSVGETVEVASQNDSIVAYVDTDFKYNKKYIGRRPSGGDAATRTFYFEAMAPGETTITIEEIFRGELENEYVITIVVVEE